MNPKLQIQQTAEVSNAGTRLQSDACLANNHRRIPNRCKWEVDREQDKTWSRNYRSKNSRVSTAATRLQSDACLVNNYNTNTKSPIGAERGREPEKTSAGCPHRQPGAFHRCWPAMVDLGRSGRRPAALSPSCHPRWGRWAE